MQSLVPPPTVTITVSSMEEGYHTGLSVTFTGRAEFGPAVDTPLNIRGTWSKSNRMRFFNLTASSRVRIVEPQLVHGRPGSGHGMVFESTLTVESLGVGREDSGNYTLSLEISSQSFTTGTANYGTYSITVLGKVST